MSLCQNWRHTEHCNVPSEEALSSSCVFAFFAFMGLVRGLLVFAFVAFMGLRGFFVFAFMGLSRGLRVFAFFTVEGVTGTRVCAFFTFMGV